MGWKIRGSDPGEGEIFRTLPDRPWAPKASYTMGTRSLFKGVKRAGRDVDNPPTSSAEVKERVVISLLRLWAFMAGSRVKEQIQVQA